MLGGDAGFNNRLDERILIPDPVPGTYEVKVHFFDAFADTNKVKPKVTLRIDGEKKQYTPRQGLAEDEVWEVASFTIPAGKGVAWPGEGRASGPVIARAVLPAKRR